MSRYRMDDGTVTDTGRAAQTWDESTYWDGNNHISTATGSQWDHETLYRSAKGRYYVVSESNRAGVAGSARWLSDNEAAAWLAFNEREFPADLEATALDVVE